MMYMRLASSKTDQAPPICVAFGGTLDWWIVPGINHPMLAWGSSIYGKPHIGSHNPYGFV